ncbi:MAG: 4-hydroxy-tetrahydrodipicolinate reductase, partial [Bacillota bacterium]
MIKVIVNGACGQMGSTIVQLLLESPKDFLLLAGVSKTSCAMTSYPLVHDILEAPSSADVVFDFSHPSAIPTVVEYCKKNGARLVMGTTGLNDGEFSLLRSASAAIPIFYSGNMSLGVSLQIELIKKAAAMLGEEFDIEITERHHRKKLDSPSGTALMLANALNEKFNDPRKLQFGRHGASRRAKNEIGVHSIRGGTITGEHDVEFFGTDESVSISHRAYSRRIFGLGALRAAQFLLHQEPGLYDMRDLLAAR